MARQALADEYFEMCGMSCSGYPQEQSRGSVVHLSSRKELVGFRHSHALIYRLPPRRDAAHLSLSVAITFPLQVASNKSELPPCLVWHRVVRPCLPYLPCSLPFPFPSLAGRSLATPLLSPPPCHRATIVGNNHFKKRNIFSPPPQLAAI